MQQILIGLPIHEGKFYCIDEFLTSLANLDLKGLRVVFFFFEVDYKPSAKLRAKINEFAELKTEDIYFRTYPIQSLHKSMSPRFLKTLGKNTLVDVFLSEAFQDFDYLLFMDSDMLLLPCTLQELLKLDADVSSVLIKPNCYSEVYHLYKQIAYLHFIHYPEHEINNNHQKGMNVDAMSTALFLLKRKVLEKLDFRFSDDFRFGSHDILFCMDANFFNFSVKVHTKIEGIHLQNKETYQKMKKDGIIDAYLSLFAIE